MLIQTVHFLIKTNMIKTKKLHILILSELSVLSFILNLVFQRNFYILEISPIFPRLKSILAKLSQFAIKRKKAKWAIELMPELSPLWEYHYRTYFFDVLYDLEAWEREFFKYSEIESGLPQYAMSYKAAVTDYIGTKEWALIALRTLLEKNKASKYVFQGLSCDLNCALRAYSPTPPARPKLMGQIFELITNLFISLIYTMGALSWIVFRTRLTTEDAQEVLATIDFIYDLSDFELLDDLAKYGTIKLVRRNRKLSKEQELLDKAMPSSIKNLTRSSLHQSTISIPSALKLATNLIRDGYKLFYNSKTLSPGLFRILATLPYHRILYKAFFKRFHPKIFWGRDPYNPIHSIRRQEANAVGCQSWAVLHSYSFYSGPYPAYRYLDFDKIFMMGRFLYEYCYKDTWSKNVEIIPTNTFRASRQAIQNIRKNTTNDILVMCSVYVGENKLVEVIRALGMSFPDRIVWLQIKDKFVNTEPGKLFLASCRKDLPNVVHTQKDIKEIFPMCQYAFSDPSTVLGEAMQFGLNAFFTDVSQIQRHVPIRQFPGICITSGKDAVEKIKNIEANNYVYPRDEVANFVHLSNVPFVDTVIHKVKTEITLAPDG